MPWDPRSDQDFTGTDPGSLKNFVRFRVDPDLKILLCKAEFSCPAGKSGVTILDRTRQKTSNGLPHTVCACSYGLPCRAQPDGLRKQLTVPNAVCLQGKGTDRKIFPLTPGPAGLHGKRRNEPDPGVMTCHRGLN